MGPIGPASLSDEATVAITHYGRVSGVGSRSLPDFAKNKTNAPTLVPRLNRSILIGYWK